MNALSAAREELAALLKEATGKQSWPYNPDVLNAPCWVVQPGSPYIEDGDTFGHFEVRYEICYLATSGLNAAVHEDIDQTVIDALIAVVNDGYTVESGGEPEPLTVNNIAYTGARLTISTNLNLKE